MTWLLIALEEELSPEGLEAFVRIQDHYALSRTSQESIDGKDEHIGYSISMGADPGYRMLAQIEDQSSLVSLYIMTSTLTPNANLSTPR